MQSTDNSKFRKLRRTNALRLNCNLEIPPNAEDNVVYPTPVVFLEKGTLQSPGTLYYMVILMLKFIKVTEARVYALKGMPF